MKWSRNEVKGMAKHTLSLRKQVGGKSPWVAKGKKPGDWIIHDGISHVANSGNETRFWELPAGTYTYGEEWYGKKERKTIRVYKDGSVKVL